MTKADASRINIGYPFAQLTKASSSSSERAPSRVEEWQRVIAGILDGSLTVGSRTPVLNVPPWVTLEVVTGGFATGHLATAGPLQSHEGEKLKSVIRPGKATDRAALNLHYVSDQGSPEITAMLESGCFRVVIPEEGALLIAAWLSEIGETSRSADLIETMLPFFDRLRFYPVPHERPVRFGPGVHLQSSGDTAKILRSKRPQTAVATMNEAIGFWAPLYDRAVALLLETVEDEYPNFERDGAGGLIRSPKGQPVVRGGWPCRTYPPDWRTRVQELLEDYAETRATHNLSGKPERPKENFARLRGLLEVCARDPGSLTGRDVGNARRILASYVSRFGGPASDQLKEVRADQARNAARPLHHVIARVIAERLEAFPTDEGISDFDQLVRGVSDVEARRSGLPQGEALPRTVIAKSLRCFEAPLGDLVERGILRSSEVMAVLLPTLTAHTRASAISDPNLRRVYESVYVAFRQRRSLLLLDLESQVKLEELPWIAAIEPWIGKDDVTRQAARDTLALVATLAVEAFPHTIFPNKLIKEFQALARGAGLRLPLVEELAADIFMGAFSEKYLLAGKAAARLLAGTIYEKYYGIPYDVLLQIDDVVKAERGAPRSPGFASLCESLAWLAPAGKWSVARNGSVIEQEQIITTHNLAVLFDGVDLRTSMRPKLSDLSRRCFRWICKRLKIRTKNWHAELQAVKNTAYAWRQMLFYLSIGDDVEIRAFADWSEGHLRQYPEEFQKRFAPVMNGLTAVIAGERFNSEGFHPSSGGRRFLGWSVGRHWLLPRRDEETASR